MPTKSGFLYSGTAITKSGFSDHVGSNFLNADAVSAHPFDFMHSRSETPVFLKALLEHHCYKTLNTQQDAQQSWQFHLQKPFRYQGPNYE